MTPKIIKKKKPSKFNEDDALKELDKIDRLREQGKISKKQHDIKSKKVLKKLKKMIKKS